MKQIGRKELIELIESIPSRSTEDKPILIYQAYHSGPQLFTEIAWPRQYAQYNFPTNAIADMEWYQSDECKFFQGYMISFDKNEAELCIQWQKKYQKPAVILLEKYVNWFDEEGCLSMPGFGELKTLTLLEKVGIEAYGFITARFDVFIYSEDEELEWHPAAGDYSCIDAEQRKELAARFSIKIHE
jgi:hypothetical protein